MKKKHNLCSTCGTGFVKRCDLIRHERIHTGERPYKCDRCGASFSQSFSLKIHFRKHTGEKPFQCQHCDQSFAHSHRLKAHMSKCHSPSPFRCHKCDLTFACHIDLDKHAILHTPSHEQIFNCHADSETHSQDQPIDNKKGSPVIITDHQNMNGKRFSGKDKSQCTAEQQRKCCCYGNDVDQNKSSRTACDCNDMGCSVKLNRFQFEASPPNKSFMCDVCGLFFEDASALSGHLKIHKENNVNLKCASCNKNLVNASVSSHQSVTCGDKICLLKNPVFVIQEASLNQGLRMATQESNQCCQMPQAIQRESCCSDSPKDVRVRDDSPGKMISRDANEKDGGKSVICDRNSPRNGLESPLSTFDYDIDNFPTFQDHFLSETEDKILLNDHDDLQGNTQTNTINSSKLDKYLVVKERLPPQATGQSNDIMSVNSESQIAGELSGVSTVGRLQASFDVTKNRDRIHPYSVFDTDSRQEDKREDKDNIYVAIEKNMLQTSNDQEEKESSLSILNDQTDYQNKSQITLTTDSLRYQVLNRHVNPHSNTNFQSNGVESIPQTQINCSIPITHLSATSVNGESSISYEQPSQLQIMTSSDDSLLIASNMNLKENSPDIGSQLNFGISHSSSNDITIADTFLSSPKLSLLPASSQVFIVDDNNAMVKGSLTDLSQAGIDTNSVYENCLNDHDLAMTNMTYSQSRSHTPTPFPNKLGGDENIFGIRSKFDSQSITTNLMTKTTTAMKYQVGQVSETATTLADITYQNLDIACPRENTINYILNSEDTGDVLFPVVAVEESSVSVRSPSPFPSLPSISSDIIPGSDSPFQTVEDRSLPGQGLFPFKAQSSDSSDSFNFENKLNDDNDVLTLHKNVLLNPESTQRYPANEIITGISDLPLIVTSHSESNLSFSKVDARNKNKQNDTSQTKQDQSQQAITASSTHVTKMGSQAWDMQKTNTSDSNITNQVSHEEENSEKLKKCANCPLGLLDASVISVLCEDECFGDMIERNLHSQDKKDAANSDTYNKITGQESSRRVEQPEMATLERHNKDPENTLFEIEDQNLLMDNQSEKKSLGINIRDSNEEPLQCMDSDDTAPVSVGKAIEAVLEIKLDREHRKDQEDSQNETEQKGLMDITESLKGEMTLSAMRIDNHTDNALTIANKTSSECNHILETSTHQTQTPTEQMLKLNTRESTSSYDPLPLDVSESQDFDSMEDEMDDTGSLSSTKCDTTVSISEQTDKAEDKETKMKIFTKSSSVKNIQKTNSQKRHAAKTGSYNQILSAECQNEAMNFYEDVRANCASQNSSGDHLKEGCERSMQCHCHDESSSGEHSHTCPICHLSFLFHKTLEECLEKPVGKANRTIKSLETTGNDTSSTHDIHLRTHLSHLPFFTNSECHTSLQQRMEVQIPPKVSYLCQICGEPLSSLSMLKQHMKSHNKVPSYSCDVCSAKFHKRCDLVKHYRIHSRERPYKCKVCSVSFSQKTNLHVHMRIHTGERPYSCTICTSSFAHSQALKLHLRFHAKDSRYICQECGKGFVVRAALEKHSRSHTGERPFVCKICFTKMSSQSSLSRHQKRHLGSDLLPFPCTLCSLRFAKSRYLNLHMKSHRTSRMKK